MNYFVKSAAPREFVSKFDNKQGYVRKHEITCIGPQSFIDQHGKAIADISGDDTITVCMHLTSERCGASFLERISKKDWLILALPEKPGRELELLRDIAKQKRQPKVALLCLEKEVPEETWNTINFFDLVIKLSPSTAVNAPFSAVGLVMLLDDLSLKCLQKVVGAILPQQRSAPRDVT